MAVTMQQIADAAGVSRGTVDRVLNHRGRVRPGVEEKILAVANDLGYVQKTRKGRKGKKRQLKLGVITMFAHEPFMLEIDRGIAQAKAELAELGCEVLVEECDAIDEQAQLDAIDRLVKAGIHGLALMPVDSDAVRRKLNGLIAERGIPVVTFNSDIVGTDRVCFVGMDNRESGRTAAGLMGLLTGGKGKVLVITGYFSNRVDSLRVEGFVEELKRTYPDIETAGVHGCFGEVEQVEKIIETAAAIYGPSISGVLIVSTGQRGIWETYERLEVERRPYVVIYDQTPQNAEALREGKVDFLIDQNGFEQGYRPPLILAELLDKGVKPESDHLYTEIKIKTKYNV